MFERTLERRKKYEGRGKNNRKCMWDGVNIKLVQGCIEFFNRRKGMIFPQPHLSDCDVCQKKKEKITNKILGRGKERR